MRRTEGSLRVRWRDWLRLDDSEPLLAWRKNREPAEAVTDSDSALCMERSFFRLLKEYSPSSCWDGNWPEGPHAPKEALKVRGARCGQVCLRLRVTKRFRHVDGDLGADFVLLFRRLPLQTNMEDWFRGTINPQVFPSIAVAILSLLYFNLAKRGFPISLERNQFSVRAMTFLPFLGKCQPQFRQNLSEKPTVAVPHCVQPQQKLHR